MSISVIMITLVILFAAAFVKAKHVVPMHYNTFPVIRQDPVNFANILREVAAIDCTIMAPGDELTLE